MLGGFWYWTVLALGAVWAAWSPAKTRELGLAVLSFGLVLSHSAAAACAYLALVVLVWLMVRRGKPLSRPAAAVIGLLAACLIVSELCEAYGTGEWRSPLGLSYLIFRLINVVVDAGRRAWDKDPGFWEFLHFMFTPALFVAGPLERWGHWENPPAELRGQRVARGIWRGAVGLLKKLYIADFALPLLASQTGWTVPDVIQNSSSAADLWQACLYAYLRIYVEFSGYSDIAIGAALLWGRRPMENFNWPVIASTPAEFWRRWHISLSQWCANCVYLPVMGQLRGVVIPMLASFTVMGLWHGIGWNRVGWAVWQVAGLLVFITWQKRLGRVRPGAWRAGWPWRLASIALTQAFIVASYVFMIRGETVPVGESLARLARMLGWPS